MQELEKKPRNFDFSFYCYCIRVSIFIELFFFEKFDKKSVYTI
jgi:hypothetical protein